MSQENTWQTSPWTSRRTPHISFENKRLLFPRNCRGSGSDCLRLSGRADGKALSILNVLVPDPLTHVIEGAGKSASPILAGSVEARSVVGILSSFTTCSHRRELATPPGSSQAVFLFRATYARHISRCRLHPSMFNGP